MAQASTTKQRAAGPVPLEAREAARRRPGGRIVMRQRWDDLLFLHWSLDPARVQATLPEGLRVDTHGGQAWIGIVPFRMRGVRLRGTPPVPGLSAFPEINLRTYVYDGRGVPGVWFYSLDAAQPLAVWFARTFFKLPYHRADMEVETSEDGWTTYTTRRRGLGPRQALRYRYRKSGDARVAEPGSLEFFLVERYVLYAERRGRLYAGRVWHEPYRCHDAELAAWDARLFEQDGLETPLRAPDHAVVSPGVSVSVFGLHPAVPVDPRA